MSEPEAPLTLGATEMAAAMARGALDHTAINAVVALNPDAAAEARESGRRIREKRPRSVLEGIPVTVKDNLLAAGMPATWGSALYRDLVPARDELPVQRLRAAGAVILGKTNVPEFTVEGYTTNALFGTTRNPWDTALTPGGSSGGAVASTAAGIAPIAIGTDGGGSIRRPAAFAGLVGLKPSIGRVPRAGGFPRILLDMEVVGPMCRTVADARAALDALAGYDPRDPASFLAADPGGGPSARPLRILYVPRIGDAPVAPEIVASADETASLLEALGHEVTPAALPFDIDPVVDAWPAVGQVGICRLLRSEGVQPDDVGATAGAMARLGAEVDGARFAAIVETIHAFRAEACAALDGVDVLMTPASAAMPWPADQPFPDRIDGQAVGPRGHAVYSGWVNAAGLPAIALPCARDAGGLPVGIQLVAGFARERLLLDLAQAIEDAAPWRQRWPRLDATP